MIIGVPTEIKTAEHRVALVPSGVESLVQRGGHRVLIERGAGEGSGFPDAQFAAAGARSSVAPKRSGAQSDMIVKVKEPVPQEYGRIRPGQILFTYFHFAADEG
jgi:alanine dehydrogenase